MFDKKTIEKAVETFKKGGIVVFPTDTVWGIGCDLTLLAAINKLYEIKKRPKNKPTAVLVAGLKQVRRIAKIPKKAQELIQKFWPGALTLVLPAKENLPKVFLGEKKTIGIRWPDFEPLTAIIKNLEKGIVAASANFAKQPAPTRKGLLDSRLLERVDLVLPGEAGGQPPSTVYDLTCSPPKILRKGPVKID